ncbi:hypothetical protein [Azospirillum soli]|uniref:hypothetical protein n=1 Tax=Azospirillum soli TaxID=1304799 RepID=UPI001AE9C95D|nr:hypothetical protein [Azospirillum soli]MBP2315474.1 hypothetical protein [Azospirillum soli]
MTENVIYLDRKAADAGRAKLAEQYRQEVAGRLAKEAAEIRKWLDAQKKIPPGLRVHFGRVVYRMFQEVEAKAGTAAIATALEKAGEGDGKTTKFRGRFAQQTPLSTPLAAIGWKWAAVVCAAGCHLRGESQALVDLVAGIDYAGKPVPNLGTIDDDAADTAGHLNLIASWVSARRNLNAYFEVLRNSDYVLAGGQIVVPDVPPAAADPDVLADGLQIPLEAAAVAALVPQVALVNRFIARVSAVGTVGDRPEPPSEESEWDVIAAQHGVEDLQVDLDVRVSLAIAPLDPGAGPTACFLLVPVVTVPLLETSVEVQPPTASGWIPFRFERQGKTRWSAVRITEWPEDTKAFVDLAGHVKFKSVSAASCLQWLGGSYRSGQHSLHIAGGDEDVGGDDLPSTGAPNRTLLAVIQRNLAHAPEALKVSTLLDEEAARLFGLLEATRLRERGRFEDAMAPLLAAWQCETMRD